MNCVLTSEPWLECGPGHYNAKETNHTNISLLFQRTEGQIRERARDSASPSDCPEDQQAPEYFT